MHHVSCFCGFLCWVLVGFSGCCDCLLLLGVDVFMVVVISWVSFWAWGVAYLQECLVVVFV